MINRRKSKQISIGEVKIGGGAPISVQSMCNTDTRDVVKTLEQIISLANKIDIYNKIVLKITYDNIYFLVETKDIEKN